MNATPMSMGKCTADRSGCRQIVTEVGLRTQEVVDPTHRHRQFRLRNLDPSLEGGLHPLPTHLRLGEKIIGFPLDTTGVSIRPLPVAANTIVH